ncbi:MAG TPA: DUF1501 domain-containing protein [Actinobacteria bacterium]|nr:DUF1501 domain-containing protein [Actinomycetota bacterium]
MNDDCFLLTRRQFLVGLGATVLTAACTSKTITVFEQTTTTAAAARPTIPPETFPRVDRTLVVVELGGGNDALSMVVPHADARYHDLRPSVRIEDPIDLDGEIGFHPNLARLADRYAAGTVAIVEGVGIHDPDLSHFTSMRRWWDGTDEPDHTGWLGRYLDGAVGYDDLLAGITIGPGPSQAMLGAGSFVVNIADATGLAPAMPWWIDDLDELFAAWAGFVPVDVPLDELTPVERAIRGTTLARADLDARLAPLRRAVADGDTDEGGFVADLRLAAALVAGESPPKAIYVHGHGDFDTHEDQPAVHGRLMADLDAGIEAFFETLEAAGATDRAVLLTTSEFGRRPEDNGGGTDHGTASTLLVVGAPVRGGRYGEPPSLRRLDADGNLRHTVDFRSVYATVLDGWLGAPHEEILRAEYETLPFL